jgi:very-long-chain ceramide synthase
MSGTFKWYYLVQLAFWFQQILVIHIEARRKDHAQMLTHHIITCTLISVTYVYRYTRAANVVLCLMDVVDLLLPVSQPQFATIETRPPSANGLQIAKILRYLRHETACNIAFGLFVVVWFIARHVMYLKLCYDIYTDVPGPTTMLFGCYNGSTNELIPDMPAHPDYFSHLLLPFKNIDDVICLNTQVKYIFLGMLLLLQSLSLVWFGMILKVVTGILTGGKAEDTRSDDEDGAYESVDEVEVEKKSRQMNVTDLNVCVGSGSEVSSGITGVSTMTRPNPRVTTGRRMLMDAENRKELLARIGCDKPI